MSGTDATFLYFETPTSHMHVLGTLVLDARARPGWGTKDLVALIEQRLDLLPEFRRRVNGATLRLHHPFWVDVPDVDVAAHVSRVACAGGGMRELADQVASFAGQQLDRSRPLWEALVVEGLDDHVVGVVFKIHHCATDGVGAARILAALFDLTPEGRTPEELALAHEQLAAERKPEPGVLDVLAHTAGGLVTLPWKAGKVVPTALRAANRVVSRVGARAVSGGAVPFQAPRAAFNGGITANRVVAYVDVPLADVKAVKNAVGGTVNDAVIAVCGGALRRYLDARGELPDRSLIAAVPVSVRTQDDTSGNKVSAMFTSLATDVDDPVERLAVVRQANNVAKGVHAAVGEHLLGQVTELAPPTLTTALARAYSGLRLADLHPVVHNVVISNVPGPPVEIYLDGCRVTGLYPLGPVLEGPGLNITVVSYADKVGVGMIACSDRLPDLADLAAAVPVALDELMDALHVRA